MLETNDPGATEAGAEQNGGGKNAAEMAALAAESEDARAAAWRVSRDNALAKLLGRDEAAPQSGEAAEAERAEGEKTAAKVPAEVPTPDEAKEHVDETVADVSGNTEDETAEKPSAEKKRTWRERHIGAEDTRRPDDIMSGVDPTLEKEHAEKERAKRVADARAAVNKRWHDTWKDTKVGPGPSEDAAAENPPLPVEEPQPKWDGKPGDKNGAPNTPNSAPQPDEDTRVENKTAANEEALRMDGGAKASIAAERSFNRMVDSQEDRYIKEKLLAGKPGEVVKGLLPGNEDVEGNTGLAEAVRSGRARYSELETAKLDTLRKAQLAASDLESNTSQGLIEKAEKHEASQKTISGTDLDAENRVIARHESLGLGGVPTREQRKGGMFHWRKKDRGPKVVESIWTVPGEKHITHVERRKRNSGELVSATTFSTEQPMRQRGGYDNNPPSELRAKMDQVRADDKQNLINKAHTRLGKRFGSDSLGDYVSGFHTATAVDGPSGAYAKKYDSQPAQLAELKKRRGFWASLRSSRFNTGRF